MTVPGTATIRLSVTVPTRLIASLSLPDVSLADGTAAVETVGVHDIGGGLFRRPIRVGLPLDGASAVAARRTERLSRILWYVIRPAKALASAVVVAGAVGPFVVDHPPRGLTLWTLSAFLVVLAAEWVLHELIARSALLQHPRRARHGVRFSYLPEPVAREIVRRNPGTSLSR
ncbi:hypothetical protein ODJ79_02305 [Actinoplanes sp. KI2]|uniref:hypothetical protein n=1 Tax=Actinoplanes sp. KI2 TaxID=2983315 RepID=UPI0021D5A1F3|nr:hypothetical protein [Actinoplanes sp. KI2]MCU7722538.1 hypothetical protein [Actinoplanes sp. KI2]